MLAFRGRGIMDSWGVLGGYGESTDNAATFLVRRRID